MSLQEFKCPNCSGPITFNPGVQEMVCPYCESVINIEALSYAADFEEPAQQEDAVWNYEGAEWSGAPGQDLVVYTCSSCSGEIVGERTLGAAACPFCGSPVVMTSVFSGALQPDLLIPFKLGKENALESLNKHYTKKRLLPDSFKEKNHLNEVKGVYVPFWLYNADVDAAMEYRGSRTRMWSDSRYYYTETSYYQLIREGVISFDNVPADGSIKIDDTMMESIEPYDMSETTEFNSAYLAGFYANKFDLDAKQCSPRVNERIINSTTSEFSRTTAGYNGVRQVKSRIRISCNNVLYALLPVWLLASVWEDRSFLFAMNGQTGKLVGDLPVDKTKKRKYYWMMCAIFAAIAGILSQGFVFFYYGSTQESHLIAAAFALTVAFLAPLIVTTVWTNKLKSIRPVNYAGGYIRQGSFKLRLSQDIFLYRNVTRTPKPQPQQARRR